MVGELKSNSYNKKAGSFFECPPCLVYRLVLRAAIGKVPVNLGDYLRHVVDYHGN